MVNDYSGSYVAINCRNKKISHNKRAATKARDFFSVTKLMWKTLGAMLLVTVVIGITSTMWYGMQVEQALNQIGSDKIINSALTRESRLLNVKHDLMLSQEQMEKAAQKIGLYTPSKSQLRYP
jgi:uncharacterized iron-regulated membrane protein